MFVNFQTNWIMLLMLDIILLLIGILEFEYFLISFLPIFIFGGAYILYVTQEKIDEELAKSEVNAEAKK